MITSHHLYAAIGLAGALYSGFHQEVDIMWLLFGCAGFLNHLGDRQMKSRANRQAMLTAAYTLAYEKIHAGEYDSVDVDIPADNLSTTVKFVAPKPDCRKLTFTIKGG